MSFHNSPEVSVKSGSKKRLATVEDKIDEEEDKEKVIYSPKLSVLNSDFAESSSRVEG